MFESRSCQRATWSTCVMSGLTGPMGSPNCGRGSASGWMHLGRGHREKACVFYMRGQPFLHFHLLKAGRRRGDIKGRTDWAQFDLPRPISATRRRAFLRELRTRYGEQ